MVICKNKIWFQNILELFCSLDIVPLSNMNIEAQLNALTRLTILVFFVLLLIDFQYSGIFLVVSLIIIILYYLQRMKSCEQFTYPKYPKYLTYPTHPSQFPNNPPRTGVSTCRSEEIKGSGLNITKSGNIKVDNSTSYRFCEDDVLLQYNDPKYTSINQRLSGPPNPKTLIPPVIAPPSHSLDYWKANNLVYHSAINEESQQEAYQSGFQVSTCCGNVKNEYLVPEENKISYGVPVEPSQQIQENYNYQTQQPYMSGEINTACGYNPSQLKTAGLPTNYSTGNCEKDPAMKRYNENLFTQIIEPGVYTRNQVNEPINSNMGISFTQQFEPTTRKITDNGIMYTQHDPNLLGEAIIEPNLGVINDVNVSNIYDPRHSGYGTSYRSYTDEKLGQTRFMYDDVDAIKMPNYITRSNIDNQPFADTYGPKKGRYGNEFNSKIRSLANNAFTDNTIKFRTELQERLMRKKNSESWQRRVAPINTHSQYMGGGMGSARR
jgi:hypothetical protein